MQPHILISTTEQQNASLGPRLSPEGWVLRPLPLPVSNLFPHPLPGVSPELPMCPFSSSRQLSQPGSLPLLLGDMEHWNSSAPGVHPSSLLRQGIWVPSTLASQSLWAILL